MDYLPEKLYYYLLKRKAKVDYLCIYADDNNFYIGILPPLMKDMSETTIQEVIKRITK